MKKISFICVLLLFFVSACSTVQYTKRSSLILVPESQEIALGITSFQEINQKEKISTDASQKALIEKVGRKIAAVADRPDYKWEFVLFDAPDKVNAFALPGGKVAFYTGIMPLCADENGVAVVMAHEIAHAIARHGAERMTHQLAAGFAGDVLSSAITKQTPNAQHRTSNIE